MSEITVLERDRAIYISLTIIILASGLAFMYFGPLVFPTPSEALPGSVFIIVGIVIIFGVIITIYPKIAELDRIIKYYKIVKKLGFDVISLEEHRIIGQKGDVYVCGHDEIDGLFFIKFKRFGIKEEEFFFMPNVSKSKIINLFNGIKGANFEAYVALPIKERSINGEAMVIFIPLSELESVFENELVGNLRDYIKNKLGVEI